jgi:hypothetical protein
MLISTLTSTVALPAGVELGGYGAVRPSRQASDALEINGLRFSCSDNGKRVSLVSLDTLYPGDLVHRFGDADDTYLFAASHTHTAPMLDSAKAGIGAVDARALDAHADVILGREWCEREVDAVALFSTTVDVPIYRRRDNPDHALNRALTAYCGMYPNPREAIDRSLHLLALMAGDEPVAVMIWHSCHPTSRSDLHQVSADYVAAIRRGVRERFGRTTPCLFLQGCAGDIRPDSRSRRIEWMPDSILNTCFLNPTSPQEQDRIDDQYFRAILNATEMERKPLDSLRTDSQRYKLTDGRVGEVPSIVVGEHYWLDFLPFEVSHRYWLEARNASPRRFLVSCSGEVQGYLPHPTQMRAGGYEVDGSRVLVGASERFTLADGGWW